MTTTNYRATMQRTLSIALLFSVTVFLQSCAKKIMFTNSLIVPAAEGTVKVKKDNNNNYNIDLNLIRLAEPSRLNPAKAIYIVWMETETNGIKNIGQLKTSSGLLSKTLKSSLTTVTAFKPTKIFITAEDDASVQYPAGQTVLATNNF